MRRLSISVEIPDRDPALRWGQSWMAGQKHVRRARTSSVATTWVGTDPDPNVDTDPDNGYDSGRLREARFVLSPAPGTHVLMYRGHPMVLHRARRDLQNGGGSAFQETLTLRILGDDQALVDELLCEAHRAAMPPSPGVNCWVSLLH